ncbi:hypothetical protein LX64_02440 [Chitinophaga skermanii]|uniref:Uncharacterized protein n=1 Tax=Chitinophaga skermanii TaxID=331697 RepID=A0A327QPK6_9BACT|nr:hypothetical protein [Chitinophaga skermanii]RAJ05283.1 hypothetical protein LX64_02440 [Chitinophaga skermanii]
MDQLKLKLQEYYHRSQGAIQQAKSEKNSGGDVLELENDILSQFGLPASKRFVQILHDFVHHASVNDQLIDYVSKKLRSAARKYLLAPVMSDAEQLSAARDQKRSPYDVLPELGLPVHEYAVFLIGEVLYRRNMDAQEVLDELRRAQKHNSWEDVVLMSKMKDYATNDIYEKLKKQHFIFVDDFVQFIRRQQSARPANKRLTPAEEGYTPHYRTITKLQVEDIVFDDRTSPSLFGKVKTGTRLTRITIALEFSQLNQILMSCGEIGAEISASIKKRLAGKAGEKPMVIDLKTEFGQILKLEECYLEIYKPQHKEGNKWVEEKDAFYFVEKILSKKEFEKRSKEEEVKVKIQECLELVGGSYVYYQRLRRLGITDEEAKLRSGLQDELLFKLSYYLNKLKD